jgi:hypothetical protein
MVLEVVVVREVAVVVVHWWRWRRGWRLGMGRRGWGQWWVKWWGKGKGRWVMGRRWVMGWRNWG